MKRETFVGTGTPRILHYLAGAVLFGTLLSCSKVTDDHGPGSGLTGGQSTLSVSLRAGTFGDQAMDETPPETGTSTPPTQPVTRVIPASGMHEDAISNVWVLQFGSDGLCVGSRYYASYDAANFPVTLLNGTGQTVAFVANSFSTGLYSDYASAKKSWATFVSQSKAITTEADLYTGTASDHYLVISGLYKGDITSAGLPAAIQMKRAVAKVRFSYSLALGGGDTFTATSLRLCRVPKTQAYLEPSAAVWPTWTNAKDTVTYASAGPGAGSYTWYLPENMRGTGTGSTSFDKSAATAPSGQGDYCTYIDLRGNYTPSGGSAVGLSYRFYLGGDLTTDYNIRRNHIYDLSVQITGANAADQRITVTSAGGNFGLTDDPAGGIGGDATFN